MVKATKTAKVTRAAKGVPAPKLGVIKTLQALLSKGGGTVPELYAGLHKVFPERGESVLTTIRLNLSHWHRNPQVFRIIKQRTPGTVNVHYSAAKGKRA